MSLKKPQESGSYMDNVKVKIAEEYKPPPKINIPMTHNQRLTFNNHVQNNLPNYDFSMESNILRKVREWKTNRLIKEEQRKIRLQSLKDKELADEPDCEETEEAVETNVPTSHVNEVEVSSVVPSSTTSYSNGMLMPTKAINYYSNILQPIPSSLGPNGQVSFGSGSVKSPFNISEFEADTSSPFDNVALKSINDVEELAKVLKIEDDASKPPTASYSNFHLQTYPNYSNMSNYPSLVSCNTQNSSTGLNGYYNSCDINPMRSFTSSYQCSPPNNYMAGYNSNRVVPREKTDVENPRQTVNFTASKTKSSPESLVKKNYKAPVKNIVPNVSNQNDPFDELSKDLQEFSRNISSMGFPLPRVARTCKVLGKDNKKVVDHLLAMSELLDLGFAEDKVSDALLQCDNDRDKALDRLIS